MDWIAQQEEEANGRITAISTATVSFDDGDAEDRKRSWGFTLLSTDRPKSALVRASHDDDDVDNDAGDGYGELQYNTNESCSVDSCEGAAHSSAASFSSSKY